MAELPAISLRACMLDDHRWAFDVLVGSHMVASGECSEVEDQKESSYSDGTHAVKLTSGDHVQTLFVHYVFLEDERQYWRARRGC